MKRIIELYLKEWITDRLRKPLILRGARQVGKTFTIRNLAQYFDNLVEINFEDTPEIVSVFAENLDPNNIIQKLSIFTKQNILPGKTLLFLDEVQVAPRVLTALRYFYEKMPELHVIAAGSLLDFAIEEVGVPVGRVQFMHLYPMSFLEYLYAKDSTLLAKEILAHPTSEVLGLPLHNQALALLGEYLVLGGMPNVVNHWIKEQNIQDCLQIQQEIIQAYQQDFQKYAKKTQLKYMDLLFQQVPLHLGERFKFNQLTTTYRKRELEPCLDLLERARVIHKVYHTDAQGLPLFSQVAMECFKVIGLDIGLSQAIMGQPIEDWFLDPKTAFVKKGNIVESFVGQELLAYQPATLEAKLFYWQRQAASSNAEVDYVWTTNQKIIPIEVKSRYGSSLQSMHQFLATHAKAPWGLRFSIHDFSQHNGIHSYPLYAVARIIEDNPKLTEFFN
jgi:predicted AAA+ superfamily ATPase